MSKKLWEPSKTLKLNSNLFKNIDISLIKCLKNKDDYNSFASYISLKDRKKNKFN